ncbi:hypothetical protein EW146_g4037 [Bondarzewia mesenterica]|uniref:Zn(2)-C6 fungal-type domain-containing protein n=1 Tax=Bondarzewia mesenterica TaxID=1095465 RepID=A0A4S4LW98_9AGAM|nr:hypothetical protein EW146_g4037 [Bondarzewia mesenterica]
MDLPFTHRHSTVLSWPILPLEVQSPSTWKHSPGSDQSLHTLPGNYSFTPQSKSSHTPVSSLEYPFYHALDSMQAPAHPAPLGWPGNVEDNFISAHHDPPAASAYPRRLSLTEALGPSPFSRSATPARQRTEQACQKCRERKTKCSGNRPVCQRCASRGLLCKYAENEKSRVRGQNKRSLRQTASAVELRKRSMMADSSSPSAHRSRRDHGALSRPRTPPPGHSGLQELAYKDSCKRPSISVSLPRSGDSSPFTSMTGSRSSSLSYPVSGNPSFNNQGDAGIDTGTSAQFSESFIGFIHAPPFYSADQWSGSDDSRLVLSLTLHQTVPDRLHNSNPPSAISSHSSFSSYSVSSYDDGGVISNPSLSSLESALAVVAADAASTPAQSDSSLSDASPTSSPPASTMLSLPPQFAEKPQNNYISHEFFAHDRSVDQVTPRALSMGRFANPSVGALRLSGYDNCQSQSRSSFAAGMAISMSTPPGALAHLAGEVVN